MKNLKKNAIKIKKFRIDNLSGKTQAEFAMMLKLSQSTISRAEKAMSIKAQQRVEKQVLKSLNYNFGFTYIVDDYEDVDFQKLVEKQKENNHDNDDTPKSVEKQKKIIKIKKNRITIKFQ